MSLPEWANWLARDENGELFAYEFEPQKHTVDRQWLSVHGGKYDCLYEIDSRYSHIKWSDSEPTSVYAVSLGVSLEQAVENASRNFSRIGVSVSDTIRPDHYKENEHDLIESWKLRFTDEQFRAVMQTLVDRYVFRYHKKNGIEDLDKATECIRRLKEWEENK